MIQKTFASMVMIFIITISLFTGAVFAAGIQIGTPTESYSYNEVITLPVSILDAEDIVTYTIDIGNNLDGVSIMINETYPDNTGTYVVNNADGNSIQSICWFSPYGVTAEEMPAFSIDVIVSDESVTHVPIHVSVVEIGSDNSGELPLYQYPVITLGNFRISDTISGSVSSDLSVSADETTTPELVVPPTNDLSDIGNSDGKVDTSIPSSSPLDSSTTSASSPGFTGVLVSFSVFTGFLVYRRRV